MNSLYNRANVGPLGVVWTNVQDPNDKTFVQRLVANSGDRRTWSLDMENFE